MEKTKPFAPEDGVLQDIENTKPAEDPADAEETEEVHKSHRRRLRRRAFPWPGALDSRRLMELMLFEPMPRCDTNDIAKEFLENCGGMAGFVDGTPEALQAMAALGEHTAVYLEALSLLCRRYEDEEQNGPREFPSLTYARQWILYSSWPTALPCLTVLMLDADLKVRFLQKYDPETESLAALARSLSAYASTLQSSYLYLAFAHPKGFLAPSRQEVEMLRTLSDACLHTETYLAEALIVNADGVRFLSASPLFPPGTFLQFDKNV